MQRTRAALAAICGGVGCVPAGSRLVEPAQAEGDLCALLAVTLARLTLLDAGALGVSQLSPTYLCSWYQVLLTNDLDSVPKRADGCTTWVQVVQLFSRRGIDTQKDADLWSEDVVRRVWCTVPGREGGVECSATMSLFWLSSVESRSVCQACLSGPQSILSL